MQTKTEKKEVFVSVETKNRDTEQSGRRIKSLFFILYIGVSSYVVLLCCTNVLVPFFNLIYFMVLFHASPLKFQDVHKETSVGP